MLESASFRLMIINGKRVASVDVPYQAILYAKGVFICGGSIVTKLHVLTAGRLNVQIASDEETQKVFISSTLHNSQSDI